MNSTAEFFASHIIEVFFFYGLAFFSMGLAVLLEISHSSQLDFAKALVPLAGFGLVHGSHEWFEMLLIIHTQYMGHVEPFWIYYLRIALLAISFLFLVAFGARLVIGPGRPQLYFGMLGIVTGLWLIGLLVVLISTLPNQGHLIAADVYTRYALAIPGAALTAWGLVLQGNKFRQGGMTSFAIDVYIAAAAFALYGGIGQLFASPSSIFPSDILNATVFLNWFSFPIQGFRALMAIIAAIFIIRSLRAFDEETRRQIQALSEAQKVEQKRLQELRSELLYRTVQAQEKERRRIARELHDETGQTLTALGLGLHGLSQTISNNPQLAIQQSLQLQALATNGIKDLQRLVSGLHPPQLDELGLLPALRWYASEVKKRFNLDIQVQGLANGIEIQEEIKLILYRIAQEAITNAVRHAQANQVQVSLESWSEGGLKLKIEDNGTGFDVDTYLSSQEYSCLGLLGMIERANLVGGKCKITSIPNQGTRVEVTIKDESKISDQTPAS